MLYLPYLVTIRPTASKLAPLLALLCASTLGACSDDGGGGGSSSNRPDGGGSILGGGNNNNNSKAIDAEDYCTRVCKVADDCDDDFDKQTCSHRCDNQASSIAKLNPKVQTELYECFDDSACKVVNASDFIAECLNEAVDELTVSKAGKDFCAELEDAANACDFDDYNEDICLQSTTAFADDVLADAKVCAGKKCELVVECLEATFTLPGELDGAPVGLDSKGKVASGSDAVSAVAALLPETTGSNPVSPVSPNVSPDEEPDASVGPVNPDPSDDTDDTNDEPDTTEETSEPEDTSDESTDTSEPEQTDTSDEPTDDTETSEPAPTDSTDTTSSSEPAPTSDATDATDTTDEPTDETDTTDTTEVTTDTTDVPTDTTDTTDTVDEEACTDCRHEVCATEEYVCVYDPETENTDLNTCLELDIAVGACTEAYGAVGQEDEWDACYATARVNTNESSLQLYDAFLQCFYYDATDQCQACQ